MHRGIYFVLILLSRFAFAQTEPVKLQWVHIPYATSYEIEVESAGQRGRPLIVRTVAIPEVSVDLPPGSYVYRMRALAAKGKGPWSEKQAFVVKPEVISLLLPATDFKVEAGQKIRFSWKASSGYRYRIQIYTSKGIVNDRETADSFLVWSAPSAGAYQWRVTYANAANSSWSEKRVVRVNPAPKRASAAIAASKIDRPGTRWSKTFWAGAHMNSYDGDFADTGNEVTASTLSGSYSFEFERKHERFSSFSEFRPALQAGVRQQSLVKETAWLPSVAGDIKYLWTLGYLKIGPLIEAGYGKTGIFTADAFGEYKTGTFWRSSYAAGLHGEFLFSRLILSSFAKFGSSSGGDSSLARGGVEPSTFLEAGIAGKLVKASRWTLQIRFFNEDVRWTSPVGDNSLTSTNWTVDIGGEL